MLHQTLQMWNALNSNLFIKDKWAATRDFQQYGILTSVGSDEHVQPPFKARNSKWRSVSNLEAIEYLSD